MLRSFVSSLGLENESTVVVLNPRLPAPGVAYGYRFGFSQSELNHLRSSDSIIPELLSRPSADIYASPLTSARGAPDASNSASIAERSEAWSRRFISSMYGSSSVDVQDALHTAIPEKLEEWFAWHKVHAGTAARFGLFTRLATNMLRSKSPVDRAYIHSHVIEAAGSAGCLTEAWVSAYRFAWIDLSAGPFAWGTGTGAKGADSFPHVASDFFSRAPSYIHNVDASVRSRRALFFPCCPFFILLRSQANMQLQQEEKFIKVVTENRCGSNERVRETFIVLKYKMSCPLSPSCFPPPSIRRRNTTLKRARR